MEPLLTLPVAMPDQERDATGLTDRAYLDVLGRCVSAAIVFWLLGQLAILDAGAVSFSAAIASVIVLLYCVQWVTELLRQTWVYAGTWRYGGIV
ncbi:hypothetical protein [Halorubrum kocurii]|uniref:Uncharacterized protein n=1 Tax=Halorubrum kocurii JCM 14978 TaxID=1230456 RepID=M0NTH0_9EURY|nr:hypothetical protein [Halorubrum kocurii]EMA59925.1 hypothetical protein C468_14073 [Halorubrum kocurii JCM 14978]